MKYDLNGELQAWHNGPKENREPMKTNPKSTFFVDISDSYCTHRYSLLISSNNSIAGVAKRIGKAFRVEVFHCGLVRLKRLKNQGVRL